MVNFSQGIYTTEFKYNDVNGVEQTLKLRPLTGKYYTMLMKTLNNTKQAISNVDGKDEVDGEKLLEILGTSTSDDMQTICLETLKRSYPSANFVELEEFASCHMIELFPVIVALNMHQK